MKDSVVCQGRGIVTRAKRQALWRDCLVFQNGNCEEMFVFLILNLCERNQAHSRTPLPCRTGRVHHHWCTHFGFICRILFDCVLNLHESLVIECGAFHDV